MTDRLVGIRGGRRATTVAVVMAAAMFAGCGSGDAPPGFDVRSSPQTLFLVHDELFSIRLDGTDRTSLGKVGDNKWRTGFPRLLADGRAIALGDDTGAIYPYFQQGDRMVRLSNNNVTLNDSVCGAKVMGRAEMVMTTTPFIPTRTAVERVDLDDPSSPELMHLERAALIANPAPYGDGRVVAVRYTDTNTEIVVIDVEQPISTQKQPKVLATVELPYYAGSPARLADGRVAYIRLDTRIDADLQPGQMWIVETGGESHAAGVDNIISLVAVEDYLVYEAAGGNHFSDIVANNLRDPPVNVTSTPYVSEHLGWSD
jgi:hypothetical protein